MLMFVLLFLVLFPVIMLIGYVVWKYIFEILRTLILTNKVSFSNLDLSVIRYENDSFNLYIESLLFLIPGFNVLFMGIILIMDILELITYSGVKLWMWIRAKIWFI